MTDMPEDLRESEREDAGSAGENVAAPLPADGAAFAALGLEPLITDALTALGYEEPTPIQREAIPPLLAGRDLLGQAATGTGKTAAFALPMVQRLAMAERTGGRGGREGPAALVLVPTRELAMQVAEAVHKYGKGLRVRVLAVYGGAPMGQQLRALSRGVDVVVATPGRALDHVRRGSLHLETVQLVVLDEADEMLDMGFAEDLEALLDATPDERQTALFSATMAPRVASIAERHLRDPERVTIAREAPTAGELPRVRQVAYVVPRAHKGAALGRVLDMEAPASALVFCRTRTEVDDLTERLNARGYRAEALHGGMSQEQRDRVMKLFRSGSAELLIATDVAARGLDIAHLSHVVNYDVPSAPDAYVHRIGRTGRAGREGVAITLMEPREHRLIRNIEHVTRQRIEVTTVPTVSDLRARKLELLRMSLQEMLLEGELDEVRVVVESLAAEHDPLDVAAAAVLLAQESEGAAKEEEEIPQVSLGRRELGRDGRGGGARERGPRAGGPPRWEDTDRPPRGRHQDDASRGDRPPPPRAPRRRREVPWEVSQIYIGAGRKSGVRPGDIVGAIANEVGVDSSAVGAIQIADRFSLVEVPQEIADDVISALRATTIKGRRVTVRLDRGFDRDDERGDDGSRR